MKRSDCPGGVGSFGFNSYDLLTMMILSFNVIGNVIVNTNKNENNNNNNDFQVCQMVANPKIVNSLLIPIFQATFGSVTANENTVMADQTSTNMAMIIVSSVGVPTVIPMGMVSTCHLLFCIFQI